MTDAIRCLTQSQQHAKKAIIEHAKKAMCRLKRQMYHYGRCALVRMKMKRD